MEKNPEVAVQALKAFQYIQNQPHFKAPMTKELIEAESNAIKHALGKKGKGKEGKRGRESFL